MDEIYLNPDRCKEHEVPYRPKDEKPVWLRANLVYKLHEWGAWDQRHTEFLQPLALDHKLLKCVPGVGPGWWRIVEIVNG